MMTTRKTKKKTRKKRPGIESVPLLFAQRLLACLVVLSSLCLAKPQVDPPGTTVVPTPGQNRLPNTREIQGRVLDAKGAPIPGAAVLLKDTKTLQVRSFVADATGTFHFFGLSTDINYQLRAETKDMTSPIKLVSVFNSRKQVKLDLKVKNKKKPYSG